MKQLLLILLTGFFLVSCGSPRGATNCWSNPKAQYIKCPNGYKPGDIIK